ncbi:tyrosine-type recombinase/integrase [Paenibacillus allorhizosphaerae]|nr:site-specific integrase [Paenibacillus allorhizosphaerae]
MSQLWLAVRPETLPQATNLYFAEKILDFSGIFPPVSDDHDIRKITREKVEEMLYASKLQGVYVTPEHRPGPAGINRWIWDNKVVAEIRSRHLREYLAPSVQYATSTFYNKYASVMNLIRHIAKMHQIHPMQVTDELLLDPDIHNRLLQRTLRPSVNQNLVQYLKDLQIMEPTTSVPSTRSVIEVHPKLQQYQLHLQQKGYSHEYIRHCIANVRELLTWLCGNIREFEGQSPQTIAIFQITNEHLLAFRSYKHKQVKAGIYSPITFCHRISAIRSFFYYLQKQFGHTPPLRRFRAIKAPRYKAREIPPDEQIEHFFQAVDLYAEDPVREQIGYRLLLELGLRLSEAAKVTWGDINLGVRTIMIHSKGKRSHTLPLVGRLYDCLLQAGNGQSRHELVLGKSPASIANQLYRKFKWYSLIAGWPFPGGVHFFRHIFITRLAGRSILPQTLKDLARVAKLDTVSLYMHLGQQNQYLTNQINLLKYDK